MKRLVFLIVFTILASGLAPDLALAQSKGFDPRKDCERVISGATDIDKMMIAAWAYGYLASSQNAAGPVDLENNKVMLRNIIAACRNNTELSLLDIVKRSKTPGPDVPGSEAHAQVLLTMFLQPGADLAGLTAQLKPSVADIRAVYADPLASQLVKIYQQMFQPGVALGPKPGHNAVITTRGTTAQLLRGDAVLRDFPGGYKDVVKFFKADVPIVRFKFVKQGETLGMAFDGLIFVHGHWVLMPKPWRGLK